VANSIRFAVFMLRGSVAKICPKGAFGVSVIVIGAFCSVSRDPHPSRALLASRLNLCRRRDSGPAG
jgi:hypothetical protein